MSGFWNKALLGVAVGALSLVSVQSAFADDPLMGRSPWNFAPEDRAGIAVIMRNVESGLSPSGPGAIICGGTSGASGQGATGSGASSTANSSCIIVNGSPGTEINNPQRSDGNQTSTSTAKSKTTNNGGGADAVSSILNGNKQGL